MGYQTDFLTGVIEGFYGRTWPMETRIAYAAYLNQAGLNTYIYCPKNDPYLRRNWQQNWPRAAWCNLVNLAQTCSNRGIHFGVGLSPVELYRNYRGAQKEKLRAKITHLQELAAPLLAILFDDMPGDTDTLAARQAEIINDVCRWSPNTRILVCPTYYSYDPVLETHFGAMPQDYWSQLGQQLPADVDIFWTGNKVCASSISAGDIQSIVTQLGRPVTVWDNYPVNDGAARSEHLYLGPLPQRHADMRPLLTGHLCNPMNQGLLSLPALGSLAQLYGQRGLDEEALGNILGRPTWQRLVRDKRIFEQAGLPGLGQQQRKLLLQQYSGLPGAAAAEVADWLRGGYRFDPACLTD